MKTKTAILALLFAGSTSAIQYRPYVDGRTPWYKTSPKAPEVGFDHDYFVPNFGEDHDIKFTKQHTAAAEARLGHVMQASFKKPAPPPQDYFVPNFGEDSDIKSTKAHLDAAEKRLGHSLVASFKAPPSPPMNYYVPNFGRDHDMIETQKHAAAAEKRLGHVWQKPAADESPKDYFVPDFGVDKDIKDSQTHTAAAERRLGHTMQASFSQPEGPPMNYPVPNFGVDHDIRNTFADIRVAEAMHGKEITAHIKPEDPPRDYYVPDFGPDQDIKDSLTHTTAAENRLGHKLSYVQAEADLHLESDPICSSAGCDQYKHKKKPRGYKINYPVPDFGVDTDILANHASLELAEAMKQHKLIMGTEESKAKWHNEAKDVDYNFAPKLDADIVTTNKNLDDAQVKLNHKWLLA